MGNTQPKRSTDESQAPGDGSASNIMVGSPMEDSGFIFPDHNEMLRVRIVKLCFLDHLTFKTIFLLSFFLQMF